MASFLAFWLGLVGRFLHVLAACVLFACTRQKSTSRRRPVVCYPQHAQVRAACEEGKKRSERVDGKAGVRLH